MDTMIKVDNIKKYFSFSKGLMKKKVSYIKAIDGISLDVYKGEILGIVGESGSGKTTLARLILNLITPDENSIYFDGANISRSDGKELRDIRKRMGVVFQDPASSLNPRSTIRESLRRPLIINGVDKSHIDSIILETIRKVSLGEEFLDRYPHQLSGGQQQRASIARAIILKPEFLLLDEPTSALDVSVQAQILNLLLDLQQEYNLTYLFITHNLSVVRYMCDRVGVMYLGKFMEVASTEEIFKNPRNPYTVGLLSSTPILSPNSRGRKKLALSGEVPSLINPPDGCRLSSRCPYKTDICIKNCPEAREISHGHTVACHRADELDFKDFAEEMMI